MGGHAFLAFVEITGGAFHIATKQVGEYTEFKGQNILSAEAVLSWSLAGIGWMAIIAAFWCATNTTVYPEAWYGETLALKFGIFTNLLGSDMECSTCDFDESQESMAT